LPQVSVLMTTYNGAAFLGQSIDSVLAQSFRNFELIVVDDGSTDATPAILAAYDDPRLRIMRNPVNTGIVAARNLGFAAVRAAHVAALDHDDISGPDRLAAQLAFLEANAGVVLVGTEVRIAEHGRLRAADHAECQSPGLMRWMLHVDNPLTYSSIMFRTAAVRQLGVFMRAEYELADDFDLYHRMLSCGDIARLDLALTLYRSHGRSASQERGQALFRNAVRILAGAYRKWLGEAADESAALVVRHLSERQPARDAATLDQLAHTLQRLLAGFCATYRPDHAEEMRIRRHAARIWWQAVRAAVRSGHPGLAGRFGRAHALSDHFAPPLADAAVSVAIGSLRALRGGR
jgi:GT2 family glycosyltransferase